MSGKKCALFGVLCFISYALLVFSDRGIRSLSPLLYGRAEFLIPTAVAFLAFFIPGFILVNLTSAKSTRQRVKPRFAELAPFAAALAFFFASLGFFIAYFFRYNIVFPCYSAATPASSDPIALWIIFGLVLPVCLEEYFLRGAFYRSLTRFGTVLAVCASSFFYAMLQNSMQAFWGALVTGALFCIISDFTSSFAAVPVIRLTCILYYHIFSGFIETYSVYGLEYVFLLLNLIIMLIACYFILLNIERFIKKGRKLNFRRIPSPAARNVFAFLINPGMLSFYVLYIMCVCDVI